VSHGVVFDEQAQWKWREDDGAGKPVDDTFTIEYIVTHDILVAKDTGAEAGSQHSVGDRPVPGQGGGDHEQSDGDRAPSRSPSIASSNLDANHDPQLPVRPRKLADIIADVEERGLQLHVASSDEPTSLAEAQADHNWTKAMEDEMATIEENKT
jgi:hypothetical protein